MDIVLVPLLHIPSVVFRELAFEAFHDVSFLLRASHLSALRGIFDAPDASANEKFVALELLKNAAVAAGNKTDNGFPGSKGDKRLPDPALIVFCFFG